MEQYSPERGRRTSESGALEARLGADGAMRLSTSERQALQAALRRVPGLSAALVAALAASEPMDAEAVADITSEEAVATQPSGAPHYSLRPQARAEATSVEAGATAEEKTAAPGTSLRPEARPSTIEAEVGVATDESLPWVETYEALVHNPEAPDERLAAVRAQLRVAHQLDHSHLLLSDEYGAPVATVAFDREYIGPKEGVVGDYRYVAGVVDPETGFLAGGGPAAEWIAQVKHELQQQLPERTITTATSAIPDFAAAFDPEKEPDLAAAIKAGVVRTPLAISQFRASEPVPGDGRSKLSYLAEEVTFTPYSDERGEPLPEAVATLLQEALPGLADHESRFNPSVTSPVGALGVFQITPDVLESYQIPPTEWSAYDRQVEVVGWYFPELQQQLSHHAAQSLATLADHLTATPEGMAQYHRLRALALLNSYNAGAKRVADALDAFVAEVDPGQWAAEADTLYYQITEHAKASETGTLDRFGPEAATYPFAVMVNGEFYTTAPPADRS